MRPATFYQLFFFTTIFLFASCKKEENFISRIHFFNGVIGGQPISIKAGNLSVADNIRYDTFKANTIVPSGTFNISFAAGSQPQDSLLTNLAANETYTIVAYDSAKRATIFMRKDVMPVTPGFGRCAVRIYTLIPDAVSLHLANDTTKSRFVITGKTFADFAGGATSPTFQEIDTIPLPVLFRGDSIRVAPVMQPFRSGKIYTIFLTGSIRDSARLPPKCVVQVHN